MFQHRSASAEGVSSLPRRPRIWRIMGLTLAAAFALLVIVTIISGPMPPTHVATDSTTVAPSRPTGPNQSTQGQEFGGSWALAVHDADGGAVYIDRDDIRSAGDRKVADLGIVARGGRKIERVSVRCSDNWLTPGPDFGDDVETSDELDRAPSGSHSVVDYVCGRAALPAKVIDILPDHS